MRCLTFSKESERNSPADFCLNERGLPVIGCLFCTFGKPEKPHFLALKYSSYWKLAKTNPSGTCCFLLGGAGFPKDRNRKSQKKYFQLLETKLCSIKKKTTTYGVFEKSHKKPPAGDTKLTAKVAISPIDFLSVN